MVFRNVVRDNSGNITSQDIIPIQRNHLYKVILTPKYNNGALVFGAMDYAIQVNDWQTGETLVFAGDANLTKQSQPNFTVAGAMVVNGGTGTDGTTNPTLIYTGIDDHSIYLTVTSNTTGTMLECSNFPSTQYGLVSSSTTNDANGNLVEIYKIDINENITVNTDYTFTISNAINTSLSRTFVLKKRPKLPLEYFATGNVKKDGSSFTILSPTDGTSTNNVTKFEWLNTSNSASAMTLFYKNSTVDSERGVIIDGKRWRLPTPWEQMAYGPSWNTRSLMNKPASPDIATGWDTTYDTGGIPGLKHQTVGFSKTVLEQFELKGTLYKIQSTYYEYSSTVYYAIRFEQRSDNTGNVDNRYRCLYRYTWDTTHSYWKIDVHYLGTLTPPTLANANSEPWTTDGYITVSNILPFGRYWSTQFMGTPTANQTNLVWDMRADGDSFRVFTDSGANSNSTGVYFFVRLICNE